MGLSSRSECGLSATSPIDTVEPTGSHNGLVNSRTVNRLEPLQSQIEEIHSGTITARRVGNCRAPCGRIVLGACGAARFILFDIFGDLSVSLGVLFILLCSFTASVILVSSLGILSAFFVLLSCVPGCVPGGILCVVVVISGSTFNLFLSVVVISSSLGIICLACIVLCTTGGVCFYPSRSFLADETAGSNGAFVQASTVSLCKGCRPVDEVCEAIAGWCWGCCRHAQESCDDDKIRERIFAQQKNG